MRELYLHLGTRLSLALEDDPSGGFVATVPGLQGCAAQGESRMGALEELTTVLEGLLEVIRQDDPKRYAQLTSASSSSVGSVEAGIGTQEGRIGVTSSVSEGGIVVSW